MSSSRFFTISALLVSIHVVASVHGTLLPLDKRWGERENPVGSSSSLLSKSNLTISPWPAKPYAVLLPDGFSLNIYSAYPYTQRPSPDIPGIQGFIHDFAENLEHAYPPPALAPREAGQTSYDTDSLTKWQIGEYLLRFTSLRAPTKIVLASLAQLAREVARHGPPSDARALIVGPKTPTSTKNYPFNCVTLSINPLGGKSGEDGPPRVAVSADT